jgi:transposase-like protein
MPTLDDAIQTGEDALTAAYTLLKQARERNDVATHKALSDDVRKLSDRLILLRLSEIEEGAKEIEALNAQLGRVIESAHQALKRIEGVKVVIKHVSKALGLIDGILKAFP